MNLYIGIDPSINSTGICVQIFDNDKLYKELFYIIVPNKLSRKEKKISEEVEEINYVIYEKTDLKEFKNVNHEQEWYKTINILNIANAVEQTIINVVHNYNPDMIYIAQEGISYGSSLRTKSIYDLAGLNYLIRNKFIHNYNTHLYICPPSEIKKFATGNGSAKKETIINIFQSIHPNITEIKMDDIADAYFMSCYANHLTKQVLTLNT